jgi:hypothetical protein
VNSWEFQGSTSGNPVRVVAQGSDANIDFRFEIKGSGLHWLGPVTGSVDTPTIGFMEVKDRFGNIRKLAVIA